MAKMRNGHFNAEDKGQDFIPAGTYLAEIIKSEFKDTKAGDGEYLRLYLKVIGGKHAGEMLFENLNLKNPNPTAVKIAERTLANICKAVGKPKGIDDSDELHNIPMNIKVTEPDKTSAFQANSIKGYSFGTESGADAPKKSPFKGR